MENIELRRRVWLNYNCPQSNNWIVMYKFDEMINHPRRQLYVGSSMMKDQRSNDDFHWSCRDLSHIYFTYMTPDLLISLVETYSGQLILIHNAVKITETDGDGEEVNETPLPQITPIDSKIHLLSHVGEITQCITNKERKLISLRDRDWLAGRVPTFKKVQEDLFRRINFTHFIHRVDSQSTTVLCNTMVEQSDHVLDLTHHYSITPENLDHISDHPQIHQLILNQNFQLNDFRWLKHFPNLWAINLSMCHQLDFPQYQQIIKMSPHLQIFHLSCCPRITIRIMLSLLKLRELESVVIDDPLFWCQKGRYELFVQPEEWKGLDCPSLRRIAINSTNLTTDVIDYLINACDNLSEMILDDDVFKQVSQDIIGGYRQDQLIFKSWKNQTKGFTIPKKVSFRNLIKNNMDSHTFSESMLQKIQERRKQTGEKEQTAIV